MGKFMPDVFAPRTDADRLLEAAGILVDPPRRDWSHEADFPGLSEIAIQLTERHPRHGENQWQPPSP
jgi:hypothetical protein